MASNYRYLCISLILKSLDNAYTKILFSESKSEKLKSLKETEINPRILNGEEILRHSMPFLADLGICTGTIIGKRHILTAVHCLDGRIWKDGKFYLDNGKEWVENKYIWIGTHEKRKIDPDKDPHGQRMEREAAWAIKREEYVTPKFNNSIIEFPIYPDKLWPELGGNINLYHLIDIALVKLSSDIRFFAGHVEKANFPSNLPHCKICTFDCGQTEFTAVGWGEYAEGTLRYSHNRLILNLISIKTNHI